MNSFSYYAYKDERENGYNHCSRKSYDLPIEVNCAGLMSLEHPFTTFNEGGREDYYLMYIIEGELACDLGGKIEAFGVGDFVIFPPGYKYKYTNKCGGVSYYFAHFTGSYVGELLFSLDLGASPEIKHAGTNKGARDAFVSMFDTWLREDKYSVRLRGAYLDTALISLASSNSNKDNKRIDTSLSYINAFYTREISVPELAKMENLSVSRYNAVFREVMGTSPTKYICELRINHACSLLNGTDIPVGIIGDSVGYPDKHFFSKIFKKHVGVSPQEYRQRGAK